MNRFEGQVTDEYSRPVPGATVYVFNQDGSTATLTSDGTTPMLQPVVADEFGVYEYWADDPWREDTWFGGKLRFKAVIGSLLSLQQQIADDVEQFAQYAGDVIQEIAQATDLLDAVNAAPASGLSISAVNRTALAGLATDRPAVLMEAGREGVFVWDSSNLKTKCDVDTRQGLYVPPTGGDGTTGAWVRKFTGPILPAWFKNSGDSDDQSSAQAALDYISNTASLHRWAHFPAGTYLVTGLTITQATGLTITGEGRTKTIIRATSTNPALAINGLWYSTIKGLSFQTALGLTTKGVVEQDGNFTTVTFTGALTAATSATLSSNWSYATGSYSVTFSDGTVKTVALTNGAATATWTGAVTATAAATAVGISTQGTQGITWEQCDFSGLGSTDAVMSKYAFTMNRQGGSSAQGSENLFLNCHFYSGSTACYYQVGFNGLNNTFIGGNFQHYPKNGIQCDTGSVQIFSVGFQSTYGYQQIVNGGYDISMAGGGVNEGICIYGCRSESLRFFNGGTSAAQRFDIRGFNQGTFSGGWAASTAVSAATPSVAYRTTASGLKNLYVVTTGGTTGASEPTWPDSGTVADGTAVWTQTPLTVITSSSGEYSDRTSYVHFSNATNMRHSRYKNTRDVVGPATVTLTHADQVVLVNANAGNVTLTLPSEASRDAGQDMFIQRKDSSTNTVTITPVTDLLNSTAVATLPPGGTAQFQTSGSGTIVGATWWYVPGGDLVFTNLNTATAVAGAVSTTAKRTKITSESLTTAAGADYTLTITNPRIQPQSLLHANVSLSSSTQGEVAVSEIVCAPGGVAGSATVKVRNIHASAALNGTILIHMAIV